MSRADVMPVVHRPGCEKADVVNSCNCGANRFCRTCGWGSGQMPCECSRASRAEAGRKLMAEMDEELGPVSEEVRERVREQWPDLRSTDAEHPSPRTMEDILASGAAWVTEAELAAIGARCVLLVRQLEETREALRRLVNFVPTSGATLIAGYGPARRNAIDVLRALGVVLQAAGTAEDSGDAHGASCAGGAAAAFTSRLIDDSQDEPPDFTTPGDMFGETP